jgi:uncharacterized protein (TIGR03437 family)
MYILNNGKFIRLSCCMAITAGIAGAQCYTFSGNGVSLSMNITSVISAISQPSSVTFSVQQQSTFTYQGNTYQGPAIPATVGFSYASGSNISSFSVNSSNFSTQPFWGVDLAGEGIFDFLPSSPPATFPPVSAWNLGPITMNYSFNGGTPVFSTATSITPCSGTTPPPQGTITSASTAFAPVSYGIAQNTWTVIKGTNLVPPTTPAQGVTWSTAPSFAQGLLPTELDGISVTVDGKPAYVYFYCSAYTSTVCSVDQINVLSPFDNALGPVPVVVTNGSSSTGPFTAVMQAIVPSLFNFDGVHVVATHLDNSDVGPTTLYPGLTTPASPGEQIVVYATGFGMPTTALTPGSDAQFGALPSLPVCSVGGIPASVAFAGLVLPGLDQLNINIPENSPGGDLAISCTFAGATTPAGNLVTVQ